MKDQVMKYNETLLWVNVLILALLSNIDNQINQILIYWCIHIIIIGQIRRIRTDNPKHKKIIMSLRRSLYVVPLLFPLLAGFRIHLNIDKLIWISSGVGLVGGCLLLLPKINTWRLVLSYDFIGMKNRQSNLNYISMAILMFLSAIIEEFFYRGFIINKLQDTNWAVMIFMSTFMFILHHIGTKWGNDFSTYDIIVQALFGVFSSILYIISNSIIPSIVAHVLYNMPHIILCIKEYVYWNFKAHLESDEYNY